MVTVKQLRDIIQNEYDDDAKNYEIYNKLLAIVAKYDGKPISKRIANDFAKAYPEYTQSWEDQYGMWHFYIYDGDSRHTRDNKMMFLIGYRTSGIFELSRFPEHNAWANRGALERNELRTALLNDSVKLATIAKALSDYDDANERLKELLDYPLPDRYDFAKLVNYKS